MFVCSHTEPIKLRGRVNGVIRKGYDVYSERYGSRWLPYVVIVHVHRENGVDFIGHLKIEAVAMVSDFIFTFDLLKTICEAVMPQYFIIRYHKFDFCNLINWDSWYLYS